MSSSEGQSPPPYPTKERRPACGLVFALARGSIRLGDEMPFKLGEWEFDVLRQLVLPGAAY